MDAPVEFDVPGDQHAPIQEHGQWAGPAGSARSAPPGQPAECRGSPELARHHRPHGEPDVDVLAHGPRLEGRPARVITTGDLDGGPLERQLAEAARMEAIGRLAAGMAHDFNNLLTAMIGYADLLEVELGDDPAADQAREIRRAGIRASELTHQVLAFVRRQATPPRPVDVNSIVVGISQMLRRLISGEVRLAFRLSSDPAVVMADPGQLEQVLVNLAINARDAMPDGGLLEVTVGCVDAGSHLERGLTGDAVLVTVADTGRGMDEHTLAHAFEPFYTTKPGGLGTGLGLSTVHRIVHQSCGEIWADSTVGQGTRISVLLPRVDAQPETISVPIVGGPVGPANPATILVVEDEPAVRAIVVSTLERAGYRVLVAGGPAEAIALSTGLEDPIDLLLTDMVMPDCTGEGLAAQLTARRPSLRVIMMSGYSEGMGGRRLPDDAPFLAKPFSTEALISVIADVLSDC